MANFMKKHGARARAVLGFLGAAAILFAALAVSSCKGDSDDDESDAKTWTAQFILDGGQDESGAKTIPSQKIVDGGKAHEPQGTFTKADGSLFSGWHEVSNGEMAPETFNFDTRVTKDITLKAKWTDPGKTAAPEINWDSGGAIKVKIICASSTSAKIYYI